MQAISGKFFLHVDVMLLVQSLVENEDMLVKQEDVTQGQQNVTASYSLFLDVARNYFFF